MRTNLVQTLKTSANRINLNRTAMRVALIGLFISLGIGNAWGSSRTYKSTMKTAVSPTGAGTAYVKLGSDGVGTSTATSATGSEASRWGATTQTYSIKANAKNGYMFEKWTKDSNVGSISSATSAATTATITGSTSGKTGTVTANFYTVTVANATAVALSPTNPSTSCEDYTGSVTFTTNYADAKEDFKAPTFGTVSGNGSFVVTDYSFTQGTGTAGTVTVNYKFTGKGHFGSDSNPRVRTNSVTLTLTSAGGENSGTCSLTANFPNIIVDAGSADPVSTINTVSKTGTATFPVQWADDKEDFTAAFSNKVGGGEWTVNSLTYAAADSKSGTITVNYTFNPQSQEGDHSARLTLNANTNAGGASNYVDISATAELLAEHDAAVISGETTTNYTTLAAAIAAANALSTNSTVKVLRNVTGLTSTIEVTKPMTLDLNSYEISGTLTSSVTKLFYLNTATAVLTINDSRNGGKIAASGNVNAALTTVLVDKGSLVLTKGNVEINNTNTGASAAAKAVKISAGTHFGMTGGNLIATTAGAGAYGLETTTNPADVNYVGITGGTITATAATMAVGVNCLSSSATVSGDPTNANVALSGATVNAETTGTTDAYAIKTAAGVCLLVNSGIYNATTNTTTAYALNTSGYTAILNGTFNATATTLIARAIHLEAGITAVRNGNFNATAATEKAHTTYIASGAKLLTYGGTFHGKLTNAASSQYATGTYIANGGTLEAQGGTFIGEIAKTGLSAAQTNYAIGIYAPAGANYAVQNATLRGQTDNTYVNGAYALHTATTNASSMTNCTLQAQSAHQYARGVYAGGATPLTMKNCSIVVNSTIGYAYGIHQETGASSVTCENCVFTVTSNTTYAYGTYVANGTLTANNCTFDVETKQSTATAAAASYLRGMYVAQNKKVTLMNCSINATGNGAYSKEGYGLYIDGSAEVENCDVIVSSINTGAYAIYNSAKTGLINVASGKFKATATTTSVSTNGTAAAGKQYLYGGYYNTNNNLAKYLPEGYGIETLPSGSTEYTEGYRYAIRPTKDVGTIVCKIGAVGYTTLEEALDYANRNSSTTCTILMVANYTLPAGNYILPANATLLVPYKSDQTAVIGTGKTGYVAAYVTPSLYRKLIFADGANMTVFGTIEVSAEKYLVSSGATGIPTGPYGQIVLDGNAHIDLEENAKLVAWGYVTGSGDINAKKNSSVYELFQLLDMKGGGVTSQLINDSRNPKIFPITHYAYQNVEATITYRPGSRAIGWTGANVQSTNQVANDVMMVGNMSSGALFLMADEGVSSDTWVRKHYNPTTDRAEYTLNNTATLGSINVDLSSINMASANYILPIASNMTITLKYGTMTITQNTYFMPGSILNIEKESTLTIPSGKELYFVDKNQWVKGYAPAQYVCVVPYSPSFNNGKGGKGSDYSPRKGLMSANTNLPSAELFTRGDIVVSGALYTTANGANIHSTDADAGKITFNTIAANKDFCQLNSTCGEGAGGPGGSPGGEKCGTLQKIGCTTGTCNCYYWNWNTWPCTSAQLKNGDDSYTSSVSGGAGTYVYKNGAWIKVAGEGCFTTETDGSGKHYYATPSDVVEVTRNSDDSYRDVASGLRRFVWDANCEWWEEETAPTAEGYYKAIKADHNGKYNYYRYISASDYWEIVSITITWNINGATSNYSVGYGTHPKYLSTNPTKTGTTTDYYIWTGWTKGSTDGAFFAKDAELPEAFENTTYYAYFETHKYEYAITFKNYDGAVLAAPRFEVGQVPYFDGTLEKPATTAKVYTFDGWATSKGGAKAYNADNLPAVTATATYFAHYIESNRTYTVQWVNYNGTVLKEEQVAYGATPSAPVTPTRPNDAFYTYTFNSWTPAVTSVTGNQTYTATYDYSQKVTKYDITFKNGSTTMYTQSLPNGETPIYGGSTPTKDDEQYTYTFDGWSATDGGEKLASLPAVSGTAKTYYAVFTHVVKKYTIRWKSEDGKQTLEIDNNVPYGTSPSYDGATPTKAQQGSTVYTFDGWSSSIGGAKIALPTVTGHATYYAHFSDKPVYTVTFNANGHGSAPASQEVVSGAKVIKPTDPSETGWTFGGWYKEAGCTNAWNFSTDVITANRTLYASWTANTNTAYTVKHFKQQLDGTYAATPDDTDNLTGTTGASVTPAVKSYTGFDAPSTQTVTILADGSRVVIYQYTRKSYTLTWALDGGTITVAGTAAGSVKFGAALTAPTVTKTGYTLKAWSPAVPATMPAEDKTYTATWTEDSHTYYYVDPATGTQTSTTSSSTPADPADYNDDDYTYGFVNWTDNLDGSYTANYSPKAERFYGSYLDVVDWTTTNIVVNVNGVKATTGGANWSIIKGSDTYPRTSCETNRTMLVARGGVHDPDDYVVLKLKGTGAAESRQKYTVPHIFDADGTYSGTNENSVIYVHSGTLTISASGVKAAAIYVSAGAELRVTGSLTVGTLVLRTTPYDAAVLTNAENISATKVYYSRVQDHTQYYQFGLPLGCNVSEVITSNYGKLGYATAAYGSAWILKAYSEASRAVNGVQDGVSNWSLVASDGAITGGQGYEIMSTYKYYREFYFPVDLDNVGNELTMSYTGSSEQHSGWNAVALPHTGYQNNQSAPEGITISLLQENGDYKQVNPTRIQPAVPFFYQAPSAGKLVFGENTVSFVKTTSAPVPRRRVTAAEEPIRIQWIHLDIKDVEGNGDQTSIYSHPTRYEQQYKAGIDVAKLSFSASRALIYSSHAYGEMAFAGVADALLENGVALTVYSPKEQELTISMRDNAWLNRMAYVWLIDNETGAQIDLLDSDYTFEATAGTTTGRFILMGRFFAPQIATDIDQAEGEQAKPKKLIIKDKLYILINGLLYDGTGKIVK